MALMGMTNNILDDVHKAPVRVCSSNDDPSSAELGFCRPPDLQLGYTEIRILSQNWESSFFSTWIVQVLLSEILGVPTSVETGSPGKSVDFYDIGNAMDYGISNDYKALEMATEYEDCRLVMEKNINSKNDEYQSCGHIILETWEPTLAKVERDLINRKIIDPPQFLGVYGQNSWFIPRFTAESDPTTAAYFGLIGEKNRRKLAETFLRPTTWKDYCDQVSQDNCTTDNGVARRPPVYDDEGLRMFVEVDYTGHFRATDQNNCTKNPDTCTGHIADYPCDWPSSMKPLLYHLNIALEPGGIEDGGGYSYSEHVDIWNAANHTRSNLIGIWWTPDTLRESFIGTDSEFQRVPLPPLTPECFHERVDITEHCKLNASTMGVPEGACDESPQALKKVIALGLYATTHSLEVQEPLWSPAHELLKLFYINNIQISEIFFNWLKMNVDKYGYDPREATCQWIVENLDTLKDFIPETYPRVIKESNSRDNLFYVSTAISLLALLLVIFVCSMTFRNQNRQSVKAAQIEFLWLLLVGLFLLAAGSIINSLPPTDFTCMVVIWLVNLGYTLELVPLIVKVAALNHLLGAAK